MFCPLREWFANRLTNRTFKHTLRLLLLWGLHMGVCLFWRVLYPFVGVKEHRQIAWSPKTNRHSHMHPHGCGSKSNRRGKPQVLVHVSTLPGQPILEFRFFEPHPHTHTHPHIHTHPHAHMPQAVQRGRLELRWRTCKTHTSPAAVARPLSTIPTAGPTWRHGGRERAIAGS